MLMDELVIFLRGRLVLAPIISLVVNELAILDQLFGEATALQLSLVALSSSNTFLKDADAALQQAEPPLGREPLEQHAEGFHDQAMDPRVYRPSNCQAAVAQADVPDVRSLPAASV
jgi:hypothetical protein